MALFHLKEIPDNDSGLTKIEVMLGCALQSGVRKKFGYKMVSILIIDASN